MIDYFMVFYSIYAAIIATVLCILIRKVPGPLTRMAVAPLSGIILILFVFFLHPLPGPGLMELAYPLSLLLAPLLSPLVILTPVLVIEYRRSFAFPPIVLFTGAFLAGILGLETAQAVFRFAANEWQVQNVAAFACMLLVSALVFFIFALLLQSQQKTEKIAAGPEPSLLPPVSKRQIVMLGTCLILLCSPFLLIDHFSRTNTTCGGFEIYSADASRTEGKTVLHLTRNDFASFPKMAPAIRDGKYENGSCLRSAEFPGDCIAAGTFSCNEERVFWEYNGRIYNESSGIYEDGRYLEYNGRYYFLTRSFVV